MLDTYMKTRIKTGDDVIVLSGKNKGQIGRGDQGTPTEFLA